MYFNANSKPATRLLRKFLRYVRRHAELIFWIIALLVLYVFDPAENSSSLCFYHWVGIDWCPGCGIGHAMHYAMHFKGRAAMDQHIMGIPALLLIFYRIKQLSFRPKTKPAHAQLPGDLDPRG